jgi:proteic killer suppression protein
MLEKESTYTFYFFAAIKNIAIFGAVWKTNMEIKFDKEYLRELYEVGKTTDKKYRFQPQTVAKYQKTVGILKSVSRVEDLFLYNGLRYEALHGNKEGLESVRVNDQYRIEFKTTKVVSETVVTICSILELSNHYK